MRIVLSGYGKMGHEVETAALSRNHEIAFRIDNEDQWNTNIDEISRCDVVIEFSTPATVLNNINRCFDINIPIVVGTTGWYQHLDEISRRCKEQGQAMFYAPNFSIGMNFVFKLNMELARFAYKYNYNMEISETHHVHKLDKPSGTAVKLADDALSNNKNYTSWALDDANDDRTLRVNAIREGEVFGIHEIDAISKCDKITVRHEAFDRTGFALGAVLAAEFIYNRKGVFTMVDLIG
ncbi:MAG: 4-hydroxy-tetrahydrodipicolinate reductase [Candidatus Limimorpha sp.]